MKPLIGRILSIAWNCLMYPFTYNNLLSIEDKKQGNELNNVTSIELKENKPLELKVDKPIELHFDTPVKLKINKSGAPREGGVGIEELKGDLLSKKIFKSKLLNRSADVSCDKIIQVFPKFLVDDLQPKSTQTVTKLSEKSTQDNLDKFQVVKSESEDTRQMELTSAQENVINTLAVCKQNNDSTGEHSKSCCKDLICSPHKNDFDTNEAKNAVSTPHIFRKRAKSNGLTLNIHEIQSQTELPKVIDAPKNRLLTIYVRVNNEACPGEIHRQIITHKKTNFKKPFGAAGKLKIKTMNRRLTSPRSNDLYRKFTISSQMKIKTSTSRFRSAKNSKDGNDKNFVVNSKSEKRKSKLTKNNLKYPFWLTGENKSCSCNKAIDDDSLTCLRNIKKISTPSIDQNDILNLDIILENRNNSRNNQIETDKENVTKLPLLVSKNRKLLVNLRRFKNNLVRKEDYSRLKGIRRSCMYSILPTKFCSENSVTRSGGHQFRRMKDTNESKLLKTSLSFDSLNCPYSTMEEILNTTTKSFRINSSVLTPSEQFLLQSLHKIKTSKRQRSVNANFNSIFAADDVERNFRPRLSDIDILQNNQLSSNGVRRSHYNILTHACPRIELTRFNVPDLSSIEKFQSIS